MSARDRKSSADLYVTMAGPAPPPPRANAAGTLSPRRGAAGSPLSSSSPPAVPAPYGASPPSSAAGADSAPSSSSSSSSVATPPSSKRDHIAREILSTERAYVESLQLVTSTFVRPLRESGILSQEAVKEIFNGFEDILGINRLLYEELIERLNQWDDSSTCIGDVFLRLLPFLKIYRVYTSTYSTALNRLLDCQQRNPAFANFVSEWETTEHQPPLPINAFLIMPVQRLPRYNLLLDDLIKNTPEEHPDRSDLQRALAEMGSVAHYINESVRQAEARAKMLEVQNSFVGGAAIIEAHRVFVKEGMLTKVCRRTDKPRMFFLFNDCLVYAEEALTSTQASARYVLRKKIMLTNLRVKKLEEERYKHGFQVINDQKSFVVYASDDAERESWLGAIQQLQGHLQTQRQTMAPGASQGFDSTENLFEKPIWIPDKEARRCLICNDEFTFLNRRHHCRSCGRLVCGSCSSKRLVLVKKDGPVRVCTICFSESPEGQQNKASLQS